MTADSLRPAVVAAVFERSWHLRTADRWVIGVTTAPYDGPMAIRVDRESLADVLVHPGMTARLAGGEIAIGSVRLSLYGAVEWTPRITGGGAPLELCGMRRDLGWIGERVIAGATGGLPACLVLAPGGNDEVSTWFRHGSEQIVGLRRALEFGDLASIGVHAVGLLGLGPGLTPSGDDVLCGLLAGLAVLESRFPASKARVAAARDVLGQVVAEHAAARTTALSRTLLHQAVGGVALQPLLDVLCTLGSGTVSGVDKLLTIGHSSGSDLLTGVCLAATAVLGWEEASGPSLARPS